MRTLTKRAVESKTLHGKRRLDGTRNGRSEATRIASAVQAHLFTSAEKRRTGSLILNTINKRQPATSMTKCGRLRDKHSRKVSVFVDKD